MTSQSALKIEELPRQSVLNVRHRELGSTFNGMAWNDMPTPWDYRTDPNDEVIAVRTCAGLYDVSMLQMRRVSGPDALAVVDYLVSRDMTKIKPGVVALCNEVDDNGIVCDDISIFCDGENRYRVVTGSGDTARHLARIAKGKNVVIEENRDTHILSLQGPKALAVLAPHTPFNLASLKYFTHADTTLFGRKVNIGRLGYSGEQGYEIYCAAADAVFLWDAILEHGRKAGVMPCSWASLDLIRVEAALAFYPYEMPGGATPWECGMGWAVSLDKKGDWQGKAAVLAARGKERSKLAGIVCKHHQAVEPGAKLYKDGKEVGVVTSPSYSRYLMKSLALAQIKPQYTAPGTTLEVRGAQIACQALVEPIPFYDPMKIRLRPENFK
ncbi:MAG TPA: aminomethyltransferase family protein [Nevskiales bacterium]|nr:aminomethyltransferase family protein [Nevskiales bacterium]